MELELESIRKYIVDAFTVIFPDIFTKEDMAIGGSGGKERYAWRIFEDRLAAHFYYYHRIGYNRGTTGLYQYRPLYADDTTTITAARDDLLQFTEASDSGSQISDDPDDQNSIHGFEEVFVAPCDAKGRIAESDEAFIKRVLEFFLPLLKYRLGRVKTSLEKTTHLLHGWRERAQICTDSIWRTFQQYVTTNHRLFSPSNFRTWFRYHNGGGSGYSQLELLFTNSGGTPRKSAHLLTASH